LCALDQAITGNGPDKVRSAAREWPDTARKWVEDLYGPGRHSMLYLSDGGYSRVFVDAFSLETGEKALLGLSSESREQVKGRWRSPEARAARDAVESVLRRAFRAFEEEDTTARKETNGGTTA